MNNTNNGSARESFQHAKQMFMRAFSDRFANTPAGQQDLKRWVDSFKLSQSEIRCEVLLNGTNSNFVFGVTPNQANSNNQQFLTENRLNLQDSFCVNEYGIFVAFPSGTTDVNYQLKTYGNTQLFTGAGVAAALDATFFCNGYFQMKCNNDVIVPYRGLFNHWYKPQTQQTAALGAASPADQIRGAEDGMITSEPNIVLIGSKNYIPEIVLKAAMSSGTFTTERAIVIFRGVLAQNSTVVS